MESLEQIKARLKQGNTFLSNEEAGSLHRYIEELEAVRLAESAPSYRIKNLDTGEYVEIIQTDEEGD